MSPLDILPPQTGAFSPYKEKKSSPFPPKSPRDVVDPRVGDFTDTFFKERKSSGSPTLAMIQHPQHGHALGDKLQDSVEEEAFKSYTFELTIFEDPTLMPIIKYDYQPSSVDPALLHAEVSEILARDVEEEIIPIPQRIVMAASEVKDDGILKFPELKKMKEIADAIVKTHNALLLPGGASIHPMFYGEELGEDEDILNYDKNPQRTVMEFCLINACETMGIPLLGVCRGHQILNVYHGGTIDRVFLENRQAPKVRKLSKDCASRYLGNMPLEAYFNHFQIVNKLGTGLESTVRLDTANTLNREMLMMEEGLEDLREAVLELDYQVIKEEEAEREFIAPAREEKTKEARELVEFLDKDSTIFSVESTAGVPIIGVQFHPEIKERFVKKAPSPFDFDHDGNNHLIKNFLELETVSKTKRIMMTELKEKHPKIRRRWFKQKALEMQRRINEAQLRHNAPLQEKKWTTVQASRSRRQKLERKKAPLHGTSYRTGCYVQRASKFH
jgi:gamma-glutamyl-gamma-aminobutyrate hydrolase PuuD